MLLAPRILTWIFMLLAPQILTWISALGDVQDYQRGMLAT